MKHLQKSEVYPGYLVRKGHHLKDHCIVYYYPLLFHYYQVDYLGFILGHVLNIFWIHYCLFQICKKKFSPNLLCLVSRINLKIQNKKSC
jgi:hypothetical protein